MSFNYLMFAHLDVVCFGIFNVNRMIPTHILIHSRLTVCTLSPCRRPFDRCSTVSGFRMPVNSILPKSVDYSNRQNDISSYRIVFVSFRFVSYFFFLRSVVSHCAGIDGASAFRRRYTAEIIAQYVHLSNYFLMFMNSDGTFSFGPYFVCASIVVDGVRGFAERRPEQPFFLFALHRCTSTIGFVWNGVRARGVGGGVETNRIDRNDLATDDGSTKSMRRTASELCKRKCIG